MLLFKPEHVGPILVGAKTETRRSWARARAVVGSVHLFYVVPAFTGGAPFASARVLEVWQEPLGAISAASVAREGYAGRDEYLAAFARINRLAAAPLSEPVWVVRFALVEGFPAEAARLHQAAHPPDAICACALGRWLRSVAN